MKVSIIFIAFFVFCTSTLLANPDIKSSMTTNGVSTTATWNSKNSLDPNKFVETTFKVLAKEYYIQRLDKVYEEIISTKENKKNHSKTVVKKIYFFARSSVDYYPEALITFKTTVTTFAPEALKNPKIRIMPQATISVDSPCQLYTDYFDFHLDRFDIGTMDIKINANSVKGKWTIRINFGLKSLFLINWLSAAKEILKIKKEPKVHGTLLFFKQRFDQIGKGLYDILK